MSGVFITRGMTVAVKDLSIRLDENGGFDIPPITLHVRFDVCPTWLQIAKSHLELALSSHANLQSLWCGDDESAKALALESEFESSMQAIMAAAIAWDALYAVLQQHINLPDSMVERWRAGRTARYTQVAEVVKRAFSIKPEGVRALRTNLKSIYRLRDLAVHPSGKIEEPLLHPELDVGVEWRFVYFRATIAQQVFSVASVMLWDLAHNGKAKDSSVVEYQKALAARLQEVFPDGAPELIIDSSAIGDQS